MSKAFKKSTFFQLFQIIKTIKKTNVNICIRNKEANFIKKTPKRLMVLSLSSYAGAMSCISFTLYSKDVVFKPFGYLLLILLILCNYIIILIFLLYIYYNFNFF